MLVVVADFRSSIQIRLSRYVSVVPSMAECVDEQDRAGDVVGMGSPLATGTWFVYVGF